MHADALIEDLKRRLLALAADPPFRFEHTSRTAAQGYMRGMTTFEGRPPAEVAAIEASLGVRFTEVFGAYLRHMGRARGHLFRGSDVARPSQFHEFRQFGQELMRETSELLELPPDAVVFLTHQGYQFSFIQPRGGFDSPVLNYTETKPAPEQIADSFSAFLDAEVRSMEEHHRNSHEMGGHYITVSDDGGTSSHFPASVSGDRATSRPFKLDEW
jgi:hypothetical protein